MRSGGFHALRMTKAQNRTAFTLWLNGCSDDALAQADPASLARSYGLNPQEVALEIQLQQRLRDTNRKAAISREFGNGAKANRDGLSRATNPFRPSDELYEAWNAGWDEEEGPAFKVAGQRPGA